MKSCKPDTKESRIIRELNREMDQTLYAISHDLRAPLRAIQGFSLALIEDYNEALDESGQDYLRRIQRASMKMDAYIDAVLSFSRNTRGEIHLEQVDLGALAREVAGSVLSSEPDRTIELRIQDGLLCLTDRRLASTLLKELFDNAVRFSTRDDTPVIEFGARTSGVDGGVEYHVRDNGVGFDMEYARDKLFGLFQRMHAGEEFPGLGIGLAVAKRVVNRLGGTIRAESRPDFGTTVFFSLGRTD